jgi:hypothetical protein
MTKLIVALRNFANAPKTASDGKRRCEYSEVDGKENALDYINFIGRDREIVRGLNGHDKVNVIWNAGCVHE